MHILHYIRVIYTESHPMFHIFSSPRDEIRATRCEVQKPAQALFEFHRGTGATWA